MKHTLKLAIIICLSVLTFTSCSSAETKPHAADKKNIKHSLYLEYDMTLNSFIRITNIKPKMGVALNGMTPIGFNTRTSQEQVVSLFSLGELPDYRIKKCRADSSIGTSIVNLSPFNLMRGGVCYSSESFNEEAFNEDIQKWFIENGVHISDLSEQYNPIGERLKKQNEVFEVYSTKREKLVSNYKKSISDLQHNHKLNYNKIYRPIIEKSLITDTSDPLKRYCEIQKFECIKNCHEDLTKFDEIVPGDIELSKLSTNNIIDLQTRIENSISSIKVSLNNQLVVKLKDDSVLFLTEAKKYNKDLTKYQFSTNDTISEMMQKNDDLKPLYEDATLSSRDKATIIGSAKEIGNLVYYQSIGKFNDVNKEYVKSTCQGFNKKNLPNAKAIFFQSCLKYARYF